MDRQTLRDWVHRYNAEGLAGLRDRPRSGRKPRLTAEQEAELVTAVERGPDPDRDGVVRWRRVDLRALIEARFAVRLHERSVGKVLRRLGFARLHSLPALEVASRLGHPDLLLIAHTAVCFTLFYSGRPEGAPFHSQQALALYVEERHGGHKILFQDPAVMALLHGALCSWLLGYPDQASERANAGVLLARRVGHPFTLCGALIWDSLLRHMRRDSDLAADRAHEALTIAREQGFPLFAIDAVAYSVWARGLVDDDSIKVLRGTLADRARIGSDLISPILTAQLGRFLSDQGNTGEALGVLQRAILHAAQTGEEWWWPEMHRMMGDTLLKRGPPAQAEAEASYKRAVELSRKRAMKSLELRAAISLARLHRDRGLHRESRDLLLPIYKWFKEGFDTPDLIEAKALLDELEATRGRSPAAAAASGTSAP